MELQSKPPCKFGAKCYRKNPKHFENYSHPKEPEVKGSKPGTTSKEDKSKSPARMKQTTLKFPKKCEFSAPPKIQKPLRVTKGSPTQNSKKESGSDRSGRELSNKRSSERKRKCTFPEKGANLKIQDKKPKISNCFKGNSSNDDTNESCDDGEVVQSTSWVFVKNESSKPEKTDPPESSCLEAELKNKTKEEIIKALFLVDMPPDFYSFYEFLKSVESSLELKGLQVGKLKLVGPFDIISVEPDVAYVMLGRNGLIGSCQLLANRLVLLGNINYSVDQDLYLCHWRFYYDPPEFQTVLASESGFHIGYWRDDPKENPVFLASNDPNKDCTFKIEAENIFGAVKSYLNDYINTCDPFSKVKMKNLLTALTSWAQKNNFSLEKETQEMVKRKKKVVSKTFHGAGIVVPVESETELGYRPLIETDANLKRICKLIIDTDDESERNSLWDNLQPLITAANIANDECDFGNSLELGIDLFCMGSPLFHNTAEHLLTVAYSLLDRPEFEKIIQVHLKHRRKGNDLSVCSKN